MVRDFKVGTTRINKRGKFSGQAERRVGLHPKKLAFDVNPTVAAGRGAPSSDHSPEKKRLVRAAQTCRFSRPGSLVLALLMFGFSGCGTKPVPAREYGALYLADRVTVVSRAAGGASYAAHFPVSRNGIRRDGILLVCPVTVQAPLNGIVGRVTLEGVATPVYNIGDGMLLEILFIEEGQRTSVYSRTFDPGRKADDRKWIPFKIPLDLPQGHDLRIELKLTAGMQGDLVADWLSVSGLRVVPKI